MDEIRRLNYLEALGVQQWVPRESLLNARSSEFAEASELLPAELEKQISKAPQSLGSETDKAVQSKAHSLENAVADSVSIPSLSATTTPVIESKGDEAAYVQNNTEQAQSLGARLNIEIHGRNKSYALFVEKGQSTSLSQVEIALLNNILKALDRLARGSLHDANVQTQSSFREVFTWPMFESPVEPDTVKGQQAMCDALNAFVSASIKRHQHNILIILGDQLVHLLDQQLFGKSTAILAAPSLDKIVGAPEYKIETWNTLLQVFKT